MTTPEPRGGAYATAAWAAPTCVAIAWMGSGEGFYDAPELVTSAAGLGTTHPPGHPLWVVASAVLTMVPLGSIALRVALGSALALGALGAAVFALARAVLAPIARSDVQRDRYALAAAWTATLTPPAMLQGVRPEVYALAGALSVTCVLGALSSHRDLASRARVTALLFGLALANHHFIALTASPAFLGLYARRVPLRSAGAWLLFGLVGLVPYCALPLRAAAPASLVRVTSLRAFLWTVSARVFHHNVGSGVPGRPRDHALDAVGWLASAVTLGGLLAVLGGAWLLARAGQRREALSLAALAMVPVAARAALGYVRANPDAVGYLVPAVAGCAVLVAVFCARLDGLVPAWACVALAFAPVAVGLPRSFRATAAHRSAAPEVFSEALLSALPPRSIALLTVPETSFRAGYSTWVEGERPDVTFVPMVFVPYPGTADFLRARTPELAGLLRAATTSGALGPAVFDPLLRVRPVYLETDAAALGAGAPLQPEGLLARLQAEGPTAEALERAAPAYFARMDELTKLLRTDPAGWAQTRDFLVYRLAQDAACFAVRGAFVAAEGARRRARDAATRTPF